METEQLRIAVVGSGIAGLGAAWALHASHDVTVYEADDRIGGHANTVDVFDRGKRVPVDTGFIVYNEVNYPNLVRLFAETGVHTEPSDMSFSVSVGGGAFEYQARGLGLAAQPSNLLSSDYRGMIRDALRFMREARELLSTDSREPIGSYLSRNDYGRPFRDDFLLPMVACIWSSSLERMLDHPASAMVRFLDNHGMLQVRHRPRWRTVTGGSRAYVRRITEPFADRIKAGRRVVAIRRLPDSVIVREAGGNETLFDHVVLGTHADMSLGMLGDDATLEERRILGAFDYQENLAVLHNDPSFMPVRRRAWSSWNYLAEDRTADRHVSLTYWMDRLQNLGTAGTFVTLNPAREPHRVVRSFLYDHPRFDRAALDAQARLPSIQGATRTWFCGSYCGNGFHEDALRSGLGVASALGSPAPWWRGATSSLASLGVAP